MFEGLVNVIQQTKQMILEAIERFDEFFDNKKKAVLKNTAKGKSSDAQKNKGILK